MTLQLVPKAGHILVRPIAAKIPSAGNIQLADYQDRPDTTGEVLALAERFCCPDCGSTQLSEVNVGDVVLFPPSAGTLVPFNGETFVLIREDSILAVVAEGVEAEVV